MPTILRLPIKPGKPAISENNAGAHQQVAQQAVEPPGLDASRIVLPGFLRQPGLPRRREPSIKGDDVAQDVLAAFDVLRVSILGELVQPVIGQVVATGGLLEGEVAEEIIGYGWFFRRDCAVIGPIV